MTYWGLVVWAVLTGVYFSLAYPDTDSSNWQLWTDGAVVVGSIGIGAAYGWRKRDLTGTQ